MALKWSCQSILHCLRLKMHLTYCFLSIFVAVGLSKDVGSPLLIRSSFANNSVHLDEAGNTISQLARDFDGYRVYTSELLQDAKLSPPCTAALSGLIRCDIYTQNFQTPSYRGSLNATLAASVCDPGCGTSLQNWFGSVSHSCQGQLLDGVLATKVGGFIWAGYNETCLKDRQTGLYCNGEYIRELYSVKWRTYFPRRD
jgi:hypothetical protein